MTHTIQDFEGNIFTTHCGQTITMTEINEGSQRAEVIDAGSTAAEIRKVTCIGCMRAWLPLIEEQDRLNTWKDYDRVWSIFCHAIVDQLESAIAGTDELISRMRLGDPAIGAVKKALKDLRDEAHCTARRYRARMLAKPFKPLTWRCGARIISIF